MTRRRTFHRMLCAAVGVGMVGVRAQPANLGPALDLATAKAIGLEIPQSLVLRAEEVFR